MLDQSLTDALKQYVTKLSNKVVFRLHPGDHPKRASLVDMLNTLVSLSDWLTLEDGPVAASLESPLSFEVCAAGASQGVVFSGIPGGHEFSSFVLAFLHAGGVDIKLDETVQALIKNIQRPITFQTVVSLSCHNCPDVVQTLNQFALINPLISHEMIDGDLFPEFVADHKVQGVPSVFMNGQAFANGKVEPATLITKLQSELGDLPALSSAQQPATVEQLLDQVQDVVVLGGGPAGVGAAIYTARKGLQVTLIAERFGGQVKDTMGIENFISTTYTTGPKLTGDLREHLAAYNITLKEHFKIVGLSLMQEHYTVPPSFSFQGDIHLVTLTSGEVIAAKSVVVATGARWRELGVPGEKENIGQGVAYCPHCDGPFFKGKKVAVIGGGNSGVEAALDLAGIVEHVSLFEFAPTLKADQVLVDQLAKRDNIDVIKNVVTQEIIAKENAVVAIAYQDRDTQAVEQRALEGVFVQIGLLPNTEFINDYVPLNTVGEVIIDSRCATQRAGIFAAGDVTTVPYKQIIIAMGEGAKAGLTAFDYLLKNT